VERQGRLRLVASPDGRENSLTIRQDAEVYLSTLARGEQTMHALRPGRSAWLQTLRGSVQLNGITLEAGDGAAISDETSLAIRAAGPAEVMLFDLP
jgi:redox-sensitive bicupin YhaK (pirin superfamily)